MPGTTALRVGRSPVSGSLELFLGRPATYQRSQILESIETFAGKCQKYLYILANERSETELGWINYKF